jgi:hypothetical protein
MTDRWGEIVFFLGAYFVVPVLVAKVPMGASWRSILIAYGIWLALLAAFGLTSTRTWGEAIGWPLIMGMFFTLPAIVVIVLVLKAAGIR